MMVLANDEDMLYELLVYGIPAMQQFAEVYISDALKKLILRLHRKWRWVYLSPVICWS